MFDFRDENELVSRGWLFIFGFWHERTMFQDENGSRMKFMWIKGYIYFTASLSAMVHLTKNRSAKIIIKMSLQDQKAINSTNYWCPNSRRNWIFVFLSPISFPFGSLVLFYFVAVVVDVVFVCLFICSFQCVMLFFPPFLLFNAFFSFSTGNAMCKEGVKDEKTFQHKIKYQKNVF